MKSRRILFVTGSQSLSGGTERACADLANFLFRQKKYEVSILSAADGRDSFFDMDPGVQLDEIYPWPRSLQINGIEFILRLRSFIKRSNPEIIIIVESFLAAFILPATLGLSVTVINWEHFGAAVTLGAPLRRLARRLAARFCSHVVVLTERDRNVWMKKYRLQADRISTIPNINPMHAKIGSRIESAKKHTQTQVVIAVGRLVAEKGYDLLLQAWRKIDTNIRAGWKLRIVGEGNLRDKLSLLAENLGIAESVEFPGRSQDIESEYRAAAIFALTSRFEGFGLVLVEAITFGLPVVAFDCPDGPAEIIEHGVSGMLVEYLNVDAFAAELTTLMASSEKREALRQASQTVLARYAPETVGVAWNRLLANAPYVEAMSR